MDSQQSSFSCDHCAKSYSTHLSLDSHLKVKHSEIPKLKEAFQEKQHKKERIMFEHCD